MKRRLPVWMTPLSVLALIAVGACDEMILNDQALEISTVGAIQGRAFLDLDGNGRFEEPDEPFAGLKLQLQGLANGGFVASLTTDSIGDFTLDSVPVGSYRIVADPATAPDTVELSGALFGTAGFLLSADSTRDIEIRAAFPIYTLDEVKALPVGRRIMTHGIALNPRAPDGDGVVHLLEGSTYLRATNVDRGPISTGDSVRFIGRTAIDQGQPVLDDVQPFELVDQAQFVSPVNVTTATAATAQGGSLDAALVRIQDAAITDTMTVGTSLIVEANDGSGPVDLVLRDFEFADFNPGLLEPDSAFFASATGLLVPVQVAPGQFRWRMTPRTQGDLDAERVLP